MSEQTNKEIKDLCYNPESAWNSLDNRAQVLDFCQGYIEYMNKVRTERHCVREGMARAKAAGFVPLEEKTILKPGDKVFAVNRDRNLLLAVVGSAGTKSGCNIIASHLDAPRLDLKQNPLFEDGGAAYLKTHYYGGIKKYQWTAIPLELQGVVYKSDGSRVDVSVGGVEDDITFTITDLLPHLASEQMKKTMSAGIEGEALNALIGGIPIDGKEKKDAVKLNLVKLLNRLFGICERDFQNAELQLVPAFPAKTVGFDRSMVGAYGQDDRVCAYTSAEAIYQVQNPVRTAVCLLVDKEEIGSVGSTGMRSNFFENTIASIISKENGRCGYMDIRATLSASCCISADVTCAMDPNYPNVQEKNNSAKLGYGVCVTKYTGSRGKSGASDASPEFLAMLSRMMDNEKIPYQTGELGKVDMGGGGTVAMFLANLDMETVDMGVPLMSMHSPFELASKVDIYSAYSAYAAFYRSIRRR